jgi:DNA polymerase III subunit delta'
MPFPASWIKERLKQSAQEKRLAHAYLLTGAPLLELEHLFDELSAELLQSPDPAHPDKHVIRPESKSRRLTVEQIRRLEHELQLKAHQAKVKIACIVAADRMCLGQAEAANAFLKTLEEPPANSLIFLLSDRPEQLLPTIRSRCLCLALESGANSRLSLDEPWIHQWVQVVGTPGDMAYRRAVLLAETWRECREQVEERFKAKIKEEVEGVEAMLEAEFLVARDLSIEALIRAIWQEAQTVSDKTSALVCCEGLEELRYALSRNIDQNLALERCSLRMSGLIEC